MAHFAWKIEIFVKLPEKIEILWKFAWKNQNFVEICLEESKFCGNLPGRIKIF